MGGTSWLGERYSSKLSRQSALLLELQQPVPLGGCLIASEMPHRHSGSFIENFVADIAGAYINGKKRKFCEQKLK